MRIFTKLILFTMITCIASISFLAILGYFQNLDNLYDTFRKNALSEIKQLENVLDSYFADVKDNVLFLESQILTLAIDDTLLSLVSMKGEEKILPQYSSALDRKLLDLFLPFQRTQKNTTLVCFGSYLGGYLEVPIVELGKGYDPRLRPWYEMARQNPDRVMLTGVYKTLYSETPQIGAVKAVVTKNQIIGVVAVSISLKNLTDLVQQAKMMQMGDILIVDSAGTILANSIDAQLNFQAIEKYSAELKNFSQMEKNGALQIHNEKIVYEISYNQNLDWHFLFLAKEKDLLQPLWNIGGSILIVSVILLIAVLLITIWISKSLSDPIAIFSEQMTRFGKKHFFEQINVKGFYEIEVMSNAFNQMTNELKTVLEKNRIYNNELERMNTELQKKNIEMEKSSNQIKEYSRKVEEMTSIAARMCSSALNRDENFLKDLLEMLMTLISKADYGSISLIEGEKWRFVHAVGHDIEILKTLDLKTDLLETGEDSILVQNIIGKDQNNFPQRIFEQIQKATKPISSSIISRLKFSNQQLGSISLDIAAGQNKSFSYDETKIVQAFSNMASAFLTMQNFIIQQGKFQKDLLTSMIRLLEIHDPYTKGHSENVARISVRIAELLGLEKAEVSRVFWSGLVHDIGKILVPATILSKPDILTTSEYEIIKEHPYWGARVLESFDDLKDVANFVLHHHERWDGKGYPQGLQQEDIPLISRILTVADAFEAMTSDRPYRGKISNAIAVQELEKNAGKQFDPKIVQCFLRALKNEKTV